MVVTPLYLLNYFLRPAVILVATSSFFYSLVRMTLLATLDCPLALRCSIDESWCLMPSWLNNGSKSLSMNYLLLLVTMECVSLCRHMIFFQQNF